MFVALGIQYAMFIVHVIGGLPCPALPYNIFPHYVMNGTIFGQKIIIEQKNVFFGFLYNFHLKHFAF